MREHDSRRRRLTAPGVAAYLGMLTFFACWLAQTACAQTASPQSPGAATPAAASHQHTHEGQPQPGAPGGARRGQADLTQGPGVIKMPLVAMKIPDVEMIDQDGRKVRLYSDLIKDKVVVLNFFFTSCMNVCLTQGVKLRKLKTDLAERFGKEVFFISITKDPTRDTPADLKRWGVEFGAGPGWSLVTGELKTIDELSLGLTAEPAASAAHSPLLIIGNDRTGVWSTGYGEAKTSELIELIDRVAGSTGDSRR